jgi:hypothetical protein
VVKLYNAGVLEILYIVGDLPGFAGELGQGQMLGDTK